MQPAVYLELCNRDEYKHIFRYLPQRWKYFLAAKDAVTKIEQKRNSIQDSFFIIKLQYEKDEWDKLEKDKKINFLNELAGKYKELPFFLSEEIRRVVEREQSSSQVESNIYYQNYQLPLLYAFLKEILYEIKKKYDIDYCQSLVLVDSSDKGVYYLLNLIGNDLNHLSILSERPISLLQITENFYNDTGLLAEIEEQPVHKLLSGSLIIDLSDGLPRYIRYAQKESYLFALIHTQEKERFIKNRRKDIHIINAAVNVSDKEVSFSQIGLELLLKSEAYRKFYFTKEEVNTGEIKQQLIEAGVMLSIK